MSYRSIQFYENGCCLRSIESEEEHLQAYRLRHQVFCDTLGWVAPSPTGLEVDSYDASAISLGLFTEQGTLLGLVRIITPDQQFMLENDFVDLVASGHRIRKMTDTIELTRLTLIPSARKEGLSSSYLRLLFKGVYQWSLANGVRYLYMEVEERFVRVLDRMGFPSTPVGPPKRLPPAMVVSLAALIDWEVFREHNRAHRAPFLEWMTTGQLTPVA